MTGDEYILSDVRFLRADRSPCLVCGHLTGDCPGETTGPVRVLGETYAKNPIDHGVLVDEDIFDEVWLTPYTRTMVLVAKAGTYIPVAKARELGLVSP